MRAHSISEAGLGLIKTFEGFRAEPVKLAESGWVVGFGHVRIAEAGAQITEDEAGALLKRDLAPVERFVNSVVTTPITQSQFDALVSFCFSVGQTAFAKSDVLRKVNAGQTVLAACAMDAWRKSSVGGESEIFDVLIQRRAAEKALFLKDDAVAAAPSVFLRAEQDHAASILAAPIVHGALPDVSAAPKTKGPGVSLAARLDQILRAEPATTLVLTQVVPDDVSDEEITTANARPVARKTDKAARRVRGMLAKSVEDVGLWALLAFGVGLVGLGASTMFASQDYVAGLAITFPGVIAAVASLYGIWRGPTPRLA